VVVAAARFAHHRRFPVDEIATLYLVRLEMERVASAAGVEPTRISFVAALRLICDE
jgi:hypothetical protein